VVGVAVLLILAAGGWAYATSFGGVFVLDDIRAVVRNGTIRSLWPPDGPLNPPAASTVAGRPVANLSFAINYALARVGAPAPPPATGEPPAGTAPLDPRPFHAGNLAIHLAAALVLFGVVRRTLESPRLITSVGGAAPWVALAVAVVWVVHPLNTAAVTYIVQRVESLMGLFYLLTVYCTVRASGETRAPWWSAAAVASCALGMATKEVMVTAPVIAAIWWWLFAPARAERPGRSHTGSVLWLFAGLFSTWVVPAFLVAGERRGPSVDLEWNAVW